MKQRNNGLLARQFAGYPDAHGDRRNLLIHILTVPLFILGNCLILAAPFTRGWLALGGIALTAIAFGLQGRGHSFESGRPAPFTGPLNAAVRILSEQWITFPRFVFSGGFSRAWSGHLTARSTDCR
jgi:uncharacterized membrane protein YGL010W